MHNMEACMEPANKPPESEKEYDGSATLQALPKSKSDTFEK